MTYDVTPDDAVEALLLGAEALDLDPDGEGDEYEDGMDIIAANDLAQAAFVAVEILRISLGDEAREAAARLLDGWRPGDEVPQ